MAGDNREIFHPTNGRVSGVIAVLVGLGGIVLGFASDGGPVWWLVALGALFAAVAWSAMLRPLVLVEDDELVLRNVVDTVRVPLAGVEEVAVRQVLAVRVGDRRFTSPAVGRSRRQLHKDGGRVPGESDPVRIATESYGLFVESRIRDLAQQDRERRGITAYSQAQAALAGEVRRDLAVPEITALVLSTSGLVLAIVLG